MHVFLLISIVNAVPATQPADKNAHPGMRVSSLKPSACRLNFKQPSRPWLHSVTTRYIFTGLRHSGDTSPPQNAFHADLLRAGFLTIFLKEIAMKLIPGSFTKRALMVGLIAGSGILAASSFAMTAGGPAGRDGCDARQGQKIHAKWEARRAERLSELKEKLKLSPDQEAAWDTFTRAAQPGMRHASADRQAMRDEFEKLSTPQRLDKMIAMSDARRSRMLERNQAIKAFYAQLNPEQQKVFDAEAMPDPMRTREHHRFQS
ncbi:MAG: Spy/CpxP family protein refolding chaperone [Pseudomonadota bacterium]